MSVSPRSNFLRVAGRDDADFLLELMEQHNSKTSYFNIEEILPSLNKAQLQEVFQTVYCICEKHIVNALAAGENNDEQALCSEEESEKAKKVIDTVVSLAKMVIVLELHIPEQLIQCVVLLHGILPGFSDNHDQIKNKISQLCELWFTKNLEEKEIIYSNSIVYLLQRSLRSKALKHDVKRVWNMKEGLIDIFDKEDENKETILSCLEKCAISQMYLNVEETNN
ncbi:condensin-2 complex subunit G2-like [Centruroides sculpturatus]|uniref:condensin-2 complex subunit G2-like n=1 Tax=Centruroides sculpturatus TaxID=218467 RepID=UPI000C6E0F2E|nr:condensin-2 complex subunit G2-like [Centruroides sculpturatus]